MTQQSLILSFCLIALHATAQTTERETEVQTVKIFGGDTETLSQPMLPKKVKSQRIQAYQFTDVHRALKQTPGVYTRDEDGLGLRPNIGLRGTNPDRSKKVVLMEDGVLVSPAPYSAPAAYYTPTMNHVESLEIFKGFAGLPYGPNSVGGAVNYVTPSIPFEHKSEVQTQYGSFNTLNLKASTGAPTSWGGYLIQASRLQTEGFKKLDTGGNTGFGQNHILSKFQFNPKGTHQSWLLTTAYSDERSNETYLGLSRPDFSASPFRRYSSSANDQMNWHQWRIRLRHIAQLGESSVLETTAYTQKFDRTWYRMDRFRNGNVAMRNVLNDPNSAANAPYYAIISGQADSTTLGTNGDLIQANNDRRYLSQGIQTKWSSRLAQGASTHALEVTARFHQDQIARNHTGDLYQMISGRLKRAAVPSQTDTLNRDQARAFTATAVDNWEFNKWVLTPAVRFESIDFKSSNYLTQSSRKWNDSYFVPGASLTRKVTDLASIRISVNEATTASGLSTAGDEVREKSTNYEAEARYLNKPRNEEASLTYFFNDYRNITGTCTVSSGCSNAQIDRLFNGGRARITGIEAQAGKGFQAGKVTIPVQANVTLLRTSFQSNFVSDSPEWGTGVVDKGDPLPYVPQVQYVVSVGSEYGKFSQDMSFNYQGKVYDQSVSEGRAMIAAYGTVDWTSTYKVTKTLRIGAKVDNLLDRHYAVSARPFGYRPGRPRFFQASLTYEF